MTINKTKVLGPFERYGLYAQGCLRSCYNCIAPDSQKLAGKLVDNDTIIKDVLQANVEGVTISGGEPLLQISDLLYIVKELKKHNKGIILYTGYTIDEIKKMGLENNEFEDLLAYIDILIDGEYIDDLNDDVSLRGSSNQNVISLTNRYKDVFDEYYNVKTREIELIQSKDNVTLIGVPNKEIFKKIIKK